ncbi:MAG: hypothetical protein R6U32_01810 [Candidatus Woesearchaeota archaeon]
MDKKILKTVLQRKRLFVPLIFTERQFNVLRKYSSNAGLSNAERKALYTSIKDKMEALSSFSGEYKDREYYISSPGEIMPSRLAEAKEIVDAYSKKHDRVFVAGSFLFSRDFNDIDIFIVRKRGYRERWDRNRHIIFLPERRLSSPVFQSASLISVSSFLIPRKTRKRRPFLSELMATYHEAVIEHMKKEKKPESIRRMVFHYNLFCRNRLLNGRELKRLSGEIELDGLDTLMKGLCKKLFSASYLYVEVHDYIKTLKDSIRNIRPNTHLIRFKDTYEEMIYGRERGKTEAA